MLENIVHFRLKAKNIWDFTVQRKWEYRAMLVFTAQYSELGKCKDWLYTFSSNKHMFRRFLSFLFI